MNPTLIEGDVILVNKLYFGSTWPQSLEDVPWFGGMGSQKNPMQTDTIWRYKKTYRLPGYGSIKHNDIVVFKSVWSKKVNLVKRLIGMPSDTVASLKNVITINGEAKLFANSAYFREPPKQRKPVQNNLIYYVPVADSLIRKTWFERVGWSLDTFGPVGIPEKGAKEKLTSTQIILYEDLLAKYEQYYVSKPIVTTDRVAEMHEFRHNYYFFMGDNRKQSADSRVWGVVPEEHIIGKVNLVVFSWKDEWRWDRFLKFVY